MEFGHGEFDHGNRSPFTELCTLRAVIGYLTHGYRAISVLVKENLEIVWGGHYTSLEELILSIRRHNEI